MEQGQQMQIRQFRCGGWRSAVVHNMRSFTSPWLMVVALLLVMARTGSGGTQSAHVLGKTLDDVLDIRNPRENKETFKGFYTLSQIHKELNALHDKVPDFVSPVQNLGMSLEQRPIEAICVGACSSVPLSLRNVSKARVTQRNTPAVLLTALHHSREPLGMMISFRFIREILTAAANGDTTALTFLSQKQLWFVPVVNPDGYEWNLKNNNRCRDHRCMARKNRRPSKRNCPPADQGVDLNRNYDYKFDDDQKGSVDKDHGRGECDETYRGTSPFSEPETRAIKYLLDRVDFDIAINWHSFGQLINVPFSHAGSGKPKGGDGQVLFAIAERLVRGSGFQYGQASKNGLYTVNGDAGDYMFGKRGIFAFSPEVGPYFKKEPFSSGMWPSEKMQPELEAESLPVAAQALWATGPQLESVVNGGIFTVVREGNNEQLPSLRSHVSVKHTNVGTRPLTGKVFVSIIGVDEWKTKTENMCPPMRAGATNDDTAKDCQDAACSDTLWMQYLYDITMQRTWLSTSRNADWSCKLSPRSRCGTRRELNGANVGSISGRWLNRENGRYMEENDEISLQTFDGLYRNSSTQTTLKHCLFSACDKSEETTDEKAPKMYTTGDTEYELLAFVVVSDPFQCSMIGLSAKRTELLAAEKGESLQMFVSKYPMVSQSSCLPCAAFRYDLRMVKKESMFARGDKCAHRLTFPEELKLIDGSSLGQADIRAPRCKTFSDRGGFNRKPSLIPWEFRVASEEIDQNSPSNVPESGQQSNMREWQKTGWTMFALLVIGTIMVVILTIWLRRRQREHAVRIASVSMQNGRADFQSFNDAVESDEDHVPEVAKATAEMEEDANRERMNDESGSSFTESDTDE